MRGGGPLRQCPPSLHAPHVFSANIFQLIPWSNKAGNDRGLSNLLHPCCHCRPGALSGFRVSEAD